MQTPKAQHFLLRAEFSVKIRGNASHLFVLHLSPVAVQSNQFDLTPDSLSLFLFTGLTLPFAVFGNIQMGFFANISATGF